MLGDVKAAHVPDLHHRHPNKPIAHLHLGEVFSVTNQMDDRGLTLGVAALPATMAPYVFMANERNENLQLSLSKFFEDIYIFRGELT